MSYIAGYTEDESLTNIAGYTEINTNTDVIIIKTNYENMCRLGVPIWENWDSEKLYKKGDKVYHEESLSSYVCIKDLNIINTNIDNIEYWQIIAKGAKGEMGTILWRGEYNTTTIYHKNDGVLYDGSSFILVSDYSVSNIEPEDYNWEWQIVAIKGSQGIQGVKGDTGLTGSQGIQGVKGDTGRQGIKGDIGLTGSQGIQGIKGDTGSQGIQGVKGDTGHIIWKGEYNSSTIYYKNEGVSYNGGSFVLNVYSTQNIEPEDYNPEWQIVALKGSQGIQGVKGDTGSQGIQGVKGNTGSQGIQGIKGDTGSQGIQGIQGLQGLQGESGLLNGTITEDFHIKKLASDKVASLVTEVNGQIIDFGTNYNQANKKRTGEHGALFRIDVRDGQPLFNVMFQDANGSAETTPFSVERTGNINIPLGTDLKINGVGVNARINELFTSVNSGKDTLYSTLLTKGFVPLSKDFADLDNIIKLLPPIIFPNLTPFGNFDNTGMSSGGYVSYSTIYKLIGTHSLQIYCNGGEVTSTSTATVTTTANHKYYLSCWVRSATLNASMQIYARIAEPSITKAINPINTWQLASGILTFGTTTTGNIRLDNNTNGSIIHYDGLIMLDLTAIFGVGKEPDISIIDSIVKSKIWWS